MMDSPEIFFKADSKILAVVCGDINFEYDLSKRTFRVEYIEKFHLKHARPSVRFSDQKSDIVSTGDIHWTMDDGPCHGIESKTLSIKTTDLKRAISIEQNFTFGFPDALILSTAFHNGTGKEIELTSMSTVGGRGTETALYVEKPPKDFFLLKDSWGGYDVEEVITRLKKIRAEVSTNFSLLHHPEIGSFAAGIAGEADSITNFSYRLEDGGPKKIKFEISHSGGVIDGFGKEKIAVVPAGGSFSPGEVILMAGDGPWRLLDSYAGRVQSAFQLQPNGGPLCGWSSWHCLRQQVSEKEILSNLDFVAGNLARYGMEYVIVDLGWQQSGDVWGGPWRPGGKFPHKMKWLADKIHERGLKAGIALRPLDYEKTKLDPSTGFTRGLIEKEVAAIAGEWGYDLIKINYMGYDGFVRRDSFIPEDDTVTPVSAIKKIAQSVRTGAGEDTVIWGIDTPLTTGMGSFNSVTMTSGIDNSLWLSLREPVIKAAAARSAFNGKLWSNNYDSIMLRTPLTPVQAQAWATFFGLIGGDIISGDRLAGLSNERLNFFTKILPPHDMTARPVDLFERALPEVWELKIRKPVGAWNVVGCFNWSVSTKEVEEFNQRATQHNIDILEENDRMTDTMRSPQEIMKIASKNNAIKKENRRIHDIFKHDAIGVNELEPLKSLQIRTDPPRFKHTVLDFKKLDLPPADSYLAYDFWDRQFLGRCEGALKVAVKQGGCRLIAIHPFKNRPQLLSSDRHITQGAIDIDEMNWNEKKLTLEGVSNIVGDNEYIMDFHLPPRYELSEFKADAAVAETTDLSRLILRIKLFDKKSKAVRWRISFKRSRK
jgi:hypothetical protein